MTNHWVDLKNSDCILAIGCNPAENHPISARWIEAARENGAQLITVDPRFTRTASMSEIYARLRPGTDIAFLGGLINYTLQNNLIHEEYVREYTNASFIVGEGYDFNEGMFASWDDQEKGYDQLTWAYALDSSKKSRRDSSLKNPRTVFQLLKKHYSRYDPDTVCAVTGTPKDDFLTVARAFCSTGRPDRAGAILYAMGITQSTHGTQNVRAVALLQLLLGNVGIAGGGVNALRGESNVQGSTDFGLLYHQLPGYIGSPEMEDQDLAAVIAKKLPKTNEPKSANWGKNYDKYGISLLKAMYGKSADQGNSFGFSYLPKRSGNYSFTHIMQKVAKGEIEGMVCMGMNPAVGGPDSGSAREGLGRLKWLVAADLWETETAAFWKRPGVNPASISTEVFLLPAACSVEKEGSITNSGRWAQWRYKAVEPPGEARSDLWILEQFHKRLKQLYLNKGGTAPEPIINLEWNYGEGHEPDVHLVAKEINGYFTRDIEIKDGEKTLSFKAGDQVPSFTLLQNDGSTAAGCWIYSGSYTGEGNMMARRDPKDQESGLGLFPGWAWCWPLNRRIVYNRASVDPQGKPFNSARPVIAWDPLSRKWHGDVPDGGAPPLAEKDGTYPFIMVPEGVGRLYAMTMKDGPFPEHYEPVESPARNLLSRIQNNPLVRKTDDLPTDLSKFPYIGTTYRVSEHWQTGTTTRRLPWLIELVPDMFIEISKGLASAKGIKQGDMVTVSTVRGSIQARALVTARLRPFIVNGKPVEQIGMPWHFGYNGIATGDSANILTAAVLSPVSGIPEYKAFLCNLDKVGKAS